MLSESWYGASFAWGGGLHLTAQAKSSHSADRRESWQPQ
jgi:hypothetical protein